MSQSVKPLNISQDEIDELIAEEAAKVREDDLLPTDWTYKRVAEEHKISDIQARRLLQQLAKDGKLYLVKVKNPNGGAALHAYRKKNER